MPRMLADLPPEIIETILGHLPTASDITNVASTCKKLQGILAIGHNAIFRDFVYKQFPTIEAGGPWQATASRLTSRSRAWDRRALIVRPCEPPSDGQFASGIRPEGRNGRQSFGFSPVIDSLEDDAGKEIVAWGAGGRLRMRTRDKNVTTWSSLRFEHDHHPETDILDLFLLRPRQNRNAEGQSILLRRANGELALVKSTSQENEWTTSSTYAASSVDCVDVSDAADPMLAVCNSTSISIYHSHSDDSLVLPHTILQLQDPEIRQRKRCAKFLSQDQIAIAPQYLVGMQAAPIDIFRIGEGAVEPEMKMAPLGSLRAMADKDRRAAGRMGANVLNRVRYQGGDKDRCELLLSGWSDGVVRLYDLRAGQFPVRQFEDPVDDGQIFSIMSIGLERVLVGSHQNGCIKTFDMRMNGRVYDYTLALPSAKAHPGIRKSDIKYDVTPNHHACTRTSRELNIFMAVPLLARYRRRPHGRQNHISEQKYTGGVYSLSSPSSSSATIYVGIENRVLQLDTICSDDWLLNRGNLRGFSSSTEEIIDISSYERPRRGKESTDTVLLRKQRDIQVAMSDGLEIPQAGWDERWYMEQHQNRRGAGRWDRGVDQNETRHGTGTHIAAPAYRPRRRSGTSRAS